MIFIAKNKRFYNTEGSMPVKEEISETTIVLVLVTLAFSQDKFKSTNIILTSPINTDGSKKNIGTPKFCSINDIPGSPGKDNTNLTSEGITPTFKSNESKLNRQTFQPEYGGPKGQFNSKNSSSGSNISGIGTNVSAIPAENGEINGKFVTPKTLYDLNLHLLGKNGSSGQIGSIIQQEKPITQTSLENEIQENNQRNQESNQKSYQGNEKKKT